MSFTLLSIEEAKIRMLEDIKPSLGLEGVCISDAFNRVLAEDIYSPIDVPAYDNSAMDGFAINTLSLNSESTIPITQNISAGDTAVPLAENTAARVFTGAMIPQNADAVIAQENCEYDESKVSFSKNVLIGENIRLKGQDVKKGEKVFASGRLLQAQDIGMLASLGLASVKVFKRLKVALVSTGNELLEPGTKLEHGKIFNSNRFMLEAFFTSINAELNISTIIADNLDETKENFAKLALQNDCVISTGGVSVGEFDYVKQALTELGELNLWKLAIKPGKPFTYGRLMGKPFFGLPGNPVAVFVTFLILVKPTIKKLQGILSVDEKAVFSFLVKSDFEHAANLKRQEYLRVSLKNTVKGRVLELYSNQSSGVLNSTCKSDGFAVLEVGRTVKKGDLMEFIPYTSL